MIILLLFSFLAGIVTILSPCILPILPIILTSSIGNENASKSRPVGVIAGFILSFTFFTLFLSSIVRISGVSGEIVRFISVIVIAGFGISLLVPQVQILWERLFTKLTSGTSPANHSKTGFSAGLVIGLSLGLLWTPCVGPILASVIALAATGTVTFDSVLIVLAYSIGTAIPMFLIMLGGQNALRRVPWLVSNLGFIQKLFGVLMILTAIGIFFNVDRRFQTFVLTTFPQYGSGLSKIEDNQLVQKTLGNVPRGLKAPEIIPGGAWFNTSPLTLEQLKGKVVVIDFWTYSCINCQRTLPYLRSWNEKYRDKGLVIIGVHAPEFEFEKNEKNVAQAIADFKLTYPVVQDNDFATWQAYGNHYWPAKYFIDKEGFIRYTHFGEGEYDKSEKVIQDLLKEAGASDVSSQIDNPVLQNNANTPETYIGSSRNPLKSGFMLAGDWQVMPESATPQKGAWLTLPFDAKEVFLVMSPKENTSSTVSVYLDGEKQFFGVDVENGMVTVDKDRLYHIISLPAPGKHTLRLEFNDNKVELFAFTFG